MAKKESTTGNIGKYRVLEEIASGSSGRVYRAEDPQRKNAPVAIKLLHSANLSSEQEREHFLQEARFLTMLKHPNILPVLDVGVEGKLPYIVTAFAPGGSLLDYLKKLAPRPLPTTEALSIITQIGEALQYAHQQNIIHRDLKPANILFSSSGTALLADFGIATVVANSMQYGTVVGTPSYMAPEQFRGTISKEGDQYSLGCIAYELVTGRRPFSASDFFTLGYKHMSETPIPPSQLNMLLSRSLEQVIFRAMAKKRSERYPSVAAFITALNGGSLASLSASPSTGMTGQPLPPPRPPVAIISSTKLPSAEPSAPSIPAQPSVPFSAFSPTSATNAGQGTAPRLPVSSTHPPVIHMDKRMPTNSNAASDPLPRAVGAVEAGSPLVISRPPFSAAEEEQAGDDEDSGRVPDPHSTGYETILMTDGDDDNDDAPVRRVPKPDPLTPLPAPDGVVPPAMPVTPPLNSKHLWYGNRRLLTIAAALLLVLLIVSTSLFAALRLLHTSASTLATATVSIVPTSVAHSAMYTMSAVLGKPDAAKLQVQGYQLTAVARQTHSVASSGVGIVPATLAQGSLVLYNDSTSPQSVPAGTSYTGNDGVQVVTLQSAVVPAGNPATNPLTWQNVTVPARAVKAGQSGNIATNDVNVWKSEGINSNLVVQNKAPFSGGRDTIYYPIVENTDLVHAATPLTRLLLQDAQTSVIAQVQPDQQVVSSSRCTQADTYSHHTGDHAATLSVTITATCTLAVYNQQQVLALATSQLKRQLLAIGTPLLPSFSATVLQAQVINGIISLQVKAVNSEFSDAQLQNMARSIAGKSYSDAQSLLIHMAGVKQATIHVNGGDGQTLPTDVQRITVSELIE